MNSEEILQRIEEIETRAARATLGPWESDGVRIYSYHSKCKYGLVADCDLELAIKGAEPQLPYDPDFIAHARTDVPLLCQIVRQLVGRLEKLEAVATAAREFVDVFWKTYGDRPGCEGCFVGEVREIERALAASKEVDDGTEPGAA